VCEKSLKFLEITGNYQQKSTNKKIQELEQLKSNKIQVIAAVIFLK
jgi:hypothetical protein